MDSIVMTRLYVGVLYLDRGRSPAAARGSVELALQPTPVVGDDGLQVPGITDFLDCVVPQYRAAGYRLHIIGGYPEEPIEEG